MQCRKRTGKRLFIHPCDDDDYDDDDTGSEPSLGIQLVDYFLNLFPVFTLSTNFPIIAITLRSCCCCCCHRHGQHHRCGHPLHLPQELEMTFWKSQRYCSFLLKIVTWQIPPCRNNLEAIVTGIPVFSGWSLTPWQHQHTIIKTLHKFHDQSIKGTTVRTSAR